MKRSSFGRRRHALITLATSAALVVGMLAAPDVASGGSARAAAQTPRRPGSDIYTYNSRLVEQHGAGLLDHLAVEVGTRHIESPTALTQIAFGRHCDTGVWVLALSRVNLSIRSNYIRPMCTAADVTALTDELTHHVPANTIVTLNSLVDNSKGRPAPAAALDFAGVTKLLGASGNGFDKLDLGRTTISVLGVPGASTGTAHYSSASLAAEPAKRATAPAAIEGRLVPDVSTLGERRYSLANLDYATYDIAADGTITIDGSVRPAPARQRDFGGYRLLVVDRRTLATQSDQLYDTHRSIIEQIRLERALTSLRTSSGASVIIFLATIGNPTTPEELPRTKTFPRQCKLNPELPFAVACTYSYNEKATDHEQTFTVPSDRVGGVLPDVDVTVQGAPGGNAPGGNTTVPGGRGARFTSTLHLTASNTIVHPGQTLYVEAGGPGQSQDGNKTGAAGGWNGGGATGTDRFAGGLPGAGGGGASDVRTLSSRFDDSELHRILVAGGGGGAGGSSSADVGGRGGAAGAAGTAGPDNGGAGGGAPSNTAGGAARDGGAPGKRGTGGAGAKPNGSGGGGGGGGGVFGGGGGGVPNRNRGVHFGGGGGAGGSSDARDAAVEPTTADAGSVTFTFLNSYGPTLGQVLRDFGATPTLVQGISKRTPNYALVASPNEQTSGTPDPFAAAEASPNAAPADTPTSERPTGELQGVLGRGEKDMRYGPVQSHAVSPVFDGDTSNGDDAVQYGFYDILAQRATGSCVNDDACPAPNATFPFSGTTPTAETKALRAVEAQLCPARKTPGTPSSCEKNPTDIRTTYGSANTAVEAAAVTRHSAPANPDGFTAADYDRVKTQILDELDAATRVHAQEDALDAVVANIPTAIPAAGAEVIKNLMKELPKEKDEPDSATYIRDIFLKVLAFVFELVDIVAAASGAHAVAAVFGIIAAAITSSFELADTVNEHHAGDGNEPEWKAEAEDLVKNVEEQLQATAQRQTEIFALIYGNWGMLSNYADNLQADPTDWDASSKVAASQLRARLRSASTLSLYQQIVPLRYDVAGNLVYNQIKDNDEFCFRASVKRPSQCGLVTSFPVRYAYAVNPTEGAARPTFQYILAAAQPEHPDNPGDKVTPLTVGVLHTFEELGLFEPDLFLKWPFARKAVANALINQTARANSCPSSLFSHGRWCS